MVGPVPPPVIPTNEIFTDGTGGLLVNHLFTTDTISLLGVSPFTTRWANQNETLPNDS